MLYNGYVQRSLDNMQYECFDKIAQEWEKNDGAFKMLHRMNVMRVEYVIRVLREIFATSKELKILDLGCGGGILSVPLAKLGFDVTGVDESENSIYYAFKLAEKENVAVNFICENALTFLNTKCYFDVLLVMESIEHVEEWKVLLQRIKENSMAKVVIISSINRTILSYIKTIFLGEYVLNLVPKGTHDWCNYVKPSELIDTMYPLYQLYNVHGTKYDFIKKNWILSSKIDSNYIISFIK
ncbi:bifunctional 2-polyprenyl-6-hydroxyphenol methylase/3-demethylubiquinol 3-O-methyltransferase UbiG [Candidatus Fokinia crypta]|uniref:Ubiquinone biosynthesis O-methyltransferase UbiG n=1 Tax=Candidatus Fokinia crypta TaxID=1920990 RepID=A0ABZ0UPE0_9RICK|nr:bifunctional 2-polyprenyl-6-hydroxyphenol methylase/3-demethylubiquinol 3-O-methyltransferase UbiG [Candidatus Fokinia cryptica]WPX97564.1 Ubiquinone biosynthesis O-methyltransferase UbiG [Candidatus Fokinia cryptica]